MQGLIDIIDGDDRLRDVGSGLNRQRLLLEEEAERRPPPAPSQPDGEEQATGLNGGAPQYHIHAPFQVGLIGSPAKKSRSRLAIEAWHAAPKRR